MAPIKRTYARPAGGAASVPSGYFATPRRAQAACVEIYGYVMLDPWASLWLRGDVELEDDDG